MSNTIFTRDDLEQSYGDMTAGAIFDCTLERALVGGVRADEEGLIEFARAQLKLTDEEEIKAFVQRAQTEEYDITPDEGEVEEKKEMGLKVMRRTENGFFLGDWMIKANIKAAASRADVFVKKRGSKGDMAEAGRVRAVGESLRDEPWRVYLHNGAEPIESYYESIPGRVSTPKGPKSIVSHVECLPPGIHFSFEYRFYPKRVSNEDFKKIASLMGNLGVGGARSFERGTFRIDRLEIERP
jgi:hypothetical protein